jgi:hypothetical protein
MSRWLVSVPVWGDRYLDVFRRAALPALIEAKRGFPGNVRIIVNTEKPEDMRSGEFEARRLPARPTWWEALSSAHRQIITLASRNDRVMLLTADMVVSREIFTACERLIASGKNLICCAGMRSLDDNEVPIGASARELLQWGWENRHPLTRACTWPSGQSGDLSRIFFDGGDVVNTRMWLPHPIALKKDSRSLRFGPTVDANLINNYSVHEIHLIADADEAACLELSPADKPFYLINSMDERIAGGEIKLSRMLHRSLLQKRVAIVGEGEDAGDAAVVDRILLA